MLYIIINFIILLLYCQVFHRNTCNKNTKKFSSKLNFSNFNKIYNKNNKFKYCWYILIYELTMIFITRFSKKGVWHTQYIPNIVWLDRWIILSLLRDLRVDSGSSSYIRSYSVSYDIRLFHLFEPRTERTIEIHSLKLLIATQKLFIIIYN